MGGNSGEEHVLLDEYIAIVDAQGVNSPQARAFREAQPELSEVFQNIDRMEASGRRARILNSVVRALWVGTFIMLAGIGIAGFRQGVNLGSAQTQLADTQTELGDVQTQLASVESHFQASEAGRATLVAELKAAHNRMQETDIGKISAELAKTKLELRDAKTAQAQMTEQMAKIVATAAEAETKVYAATAELVASEGAAKDAQTELEKLKAKFDLVMLRATTTATAAARDAEAPRGANITARLAFSRNGNSLASVSRNNVVQIWDLRSHAIVQQATSGERGQILAVSGADIGDWSAVSRLAENQVGLWNVRAEGGVREIQGEWGPVSACAFSPDGRLLALAALDRLTWIVDTESGRPVMDPLDGHREPAAIGAPNPQ